MPRSPTADPNQSARLSSLVAIADGKQGGEGDGEGGGGAARGEGGEGCGGQGVSTSDRGLRAAGHAHLSVTSRS